MQPIGDQRSSARLLERQLRILVKILIELHEIGVQRVVECHGHTDTPLTPGRHGPERTVAAWSSIQKGRSGSGVPLCAHPRLLAAAGDE